MEGRLEEKPEEYPDPRLSGRRRSEPLREAGDFADVISRVDESLHVADMTVVMVVVVGEKEGTGLGFNILILNLI